MEYRVQLGDQEATVLVTEEADGYLVEIGGQRFVVDAHELGAKLLSLLVNGRSHEAEVVRQPEGYTITVDGHPYSVTVQPELMARAGAGRRVATSEGPIELTSPMPGVVVDVRVSPGERVSAGAPLIVIEAMKMQNEITADRAGVVETIAVEAGDAVTAGQLLAALRRAPA